MKSKDDRFEIRYTRSPGPTDDFYGVAEHVWVLVETTTGRVVRKLEGEEYSDRYIGARNVRFSEDGKALVFEDVTPLMM
jgi:hypothetical protein